MNECHIQVNYVTLDLFPFPQKREENGDFGGKVISGTCVFLFLRYQLFVVVAPTTVLSVSFHVVITCLVHRLILLPPGAGPGVPDNSHLLASVMGSHRVSVCQEPQERPHSDVLRSYDLLRNSRTFVSTKCL